MQEYYSWIWYASGLNSWIDEWSLSLRPNLGNRSGKLKEHKRDRIFRLQNLTNKEICFKAATAVTGALTTAGSGFSSGNSAKSIASIKCLLRYIGGSAIAGVLAPRPIAFELRNPGGAALSFVCAAVSLLIATMKAKAGDETFIFFSLAASGIQNSLTSTFSAYLCRTSHFSGTTSDIGTLLGQLLRGNVEGLPKLKVLSLLFLSFWAGAFVSVPLGNACSHNTLLIAAGIYLAVAFAIALSSQNRTKIE